MMLKTIILILLAASVEAVGICGQTLEVRTRNNPYSPSPSSKTRQVSAAVLPVKRDTREVAFTTSIPQESPAEQRLTIAQRTYEIAKKADRRTEAASSAPTEHYKVGVGDVLFIDLKDSPRASGYFTVRPDGTIDYPLGGDNVAVAGQTTEVIEELLASAITLFPDPKIEVKIRYHSSHKITVSGLAEATGEISLQREAIPLYVIRAQAGVDAKATIVVITRAPGITAESHDLKDPNTDNILIYPGYSIEFTSDKSAAGNVYYYIAGDVNSTGQKEYVSGLTLLQAIVANGGQSGSLKTATIRRRNDKGTLNVVEHNLKVIRNGKASDPSLFPGDMIEVGGR